MKKKKMVTPNSVWCFLLTLHRYYSWQGSKVVVIKSESVVYKY